MTPCIVMHGSQVDAVTGQDKVIKDNQHFIYFHKGLHASADDADTHRMLLLREDHIRFVGNC